MLINFDDNNGDVHRITCEDLPSILFRAGDADFDTFTDRHLGSEAGPNALYVSLRGDLKIIAVVSANCVGEPANLTALRRNDNKHER